MWGCTSSVADRFHIFGARYFVNLLTVKLVQEAKWGRKGDEFLVLRLLLKPAS